MTRCHSTFASCRGARGPSQPAAIPSGLLAAACAAALAAAACSSEPTPSGAPPHDATAAAEIARIAGKLSSPEWAGRDEGSAGGIAARAFLLQEWARCGVEPLLPDGFEQPITTGAGANIVGRIEGTDPTLKDRHVLVSAHYDHIGACEGGTCLGAYDNAVSVAIVIHTACELARAPHKRSMFIAHWDAEEPPTVRTEKMGSEFYVANPVFPLDRIDVAIVLDLVGGNLWPGYQGHFALGAETSSAVSAALAATEVPAGLGLQTGGLHLVEKTMLGPHPWSDYDAFRKAKVPVLFFSDGQNRNYHTPNDTMANVDLPKSARAFTHLKSLVGRLLDATQTPEFDEKAADLLKDARTARKVLEDALAEGMPAKVGLDQESADLIRSDLEAAKGVEAKLAAGGNASEDDLKALRSGVQRLMCLCSNLSKAICNAM